MDFPCSTSATTTKKQRTVLLTVLITILKRYNSAKMRTLSACSGICMFKKTRGGGDSRMKHMYFFSANAKNSCSICEIALKEIITLIEMTVPGSMINETRSP